MWFTLSWNVIDFVGITVMIKIFSQEKSRTSGESFLSIYADWVNEK